MESFKSLQHFCECMEISKDDVVRVLMPNWWLEVDYDVIGYTDGKETHCCSVDTFVFVWVPELDYDGYFSSKDLRKIQL